MKNFMVTFGQVMVGVTGLAIAALAGAEIGKATGMVIEKMEALKVRPEEEEEE